MILPIRRGGRIVKACLCLLLPWSDGGSDQPGSYGSGLLPFEQGTRKAVPHYCCSQASMSSSPVSDLLPPVKSKFHGVLAEPWSVDRLGGYLFPLGQPDPAVHGALPEKPCATSRTSLLSWAENRPHQSYHEPRFCPQPHPSRGKSPVNKHLRLLKRRIN